MPGNAKRLSITRTIPSGSGASRGRFIGLGLGAAVAVVGAPAKAAQFEFKCGLDLPSNHPSSYRLQQMWAAIEKESGGRMHTQLFPNSQLGGDPAMFSQLRLGALTFFLIGPGNLAEVVPAADVAYIGFAFRDVTEGLRVMDGPLGGYVRTQTEAKGMHAFRSFWSAGMFQVSSSSHPIRTPDDVHDFKVRITQGRISSDLWKVLGASPVVLSINEAYTALQTKLVDGIAVPMAAIETLHLYEVQKYLSLTNHTSAGNWLLVNGDIWKKIPPDLQDIIERNNTKYCQLARRDVANIEASAQAQLTSQGMTVNPVDQAAFRAKLRPYYESWAKTFGSTEWALLQDSLAQKLI